MQRQPGSNPGACAALACPVAGRQLMHCLAGLAGSRCNLAPLLAVYSTSTICSQLATVRLTPAGAFSCLCFWGLQGSGREPVSKRSQQQWARIACPRVSDLLRAPIAPSPPPAAAPTPAAPPAAGWPLLVLRSLPRSLPPVLPPASAAHRAGGPLGRRPWLQPPTAGSRAAGRRCGEPSYLLVKWLRWAEAAAKLREEQGGR